MITSKRCFICPWNRGQELTSSITDTSHMPKSVSERTWLTIILLWYECSLRFLKICNTAILQCNFYLNLKKRFWSSSTYTYIHYSIFTFRKRNFFKLMKGYLKHIVRQNIQDKMLPNTYKCYKNSKKLCTCCFGGLFDFTDYKGYHPCSNTIKNTYSFQYTTPEM